MKILPNIPFQILLTKISSQHVGIPKHMILGNLCNDLATVIDLNQLPLLSTTERTSATAVKFLVGDNGNAHSPEGFIVQHHMTSVIPSASRMTIPLIAKLHLHAGTSQNSVRWTRRSHENRHPQDRPVTRLINSIPSRAGPKARDFEKNEIDNVLSKNIIETT